MFDSVLYKASPLRLQEGMISARAYIRRALREGKLYEAMLRRALERERWSQRDLEVYQLDRLRSILAHATKKVPYYEPLRERSPSLLDREGLKAYLSILPTMSKRDIIEAGPRLLSKGTPLSRIKGSTSGTTGTPVTIFQDLRAITRETAFIARQLAWTGYRVGEPRAWIRGDMIVPTDDTTGPFWRLNRCENMLMMSSYHLSERTAPMYLEALAALKPTMIQAYPSSVAFLARYLEARNEHFAAESLRAVVTSSETLSDDDRRVVTERFHCTVFDWYGAFERVAAIGTCELGQYHLLTDYSLVELEPIGNDQFELIGTNFGNYVMPLIRFRTGDIIELPDTNVPCACGRSFPVVARVLGRQDDYIKLSDGRCIGRLDHVFKGMRGIAEAQIVQDEIDSIRILLVPVGHFSDDAERLLVTNTRRRLGPGVRITVELVSAIPRTRSGKFRAVVSRVE